MSDILIRTKEDSENINYLTKKKIPNYRQAYSDRTSFIMACLSELVYIRFNEPFFDKNDKKLLDRLSKLIDDNKLESFRKLYETFGYDYKDEVSKLKEELKILNIELIKTFDSNGTQAMIISNGFFYALVFRGTEVSSIKDIKTDLDAKIIHCETDGKIHRGFNNAFNEVHIEIQEYLNNELKEEKPLFITGHSLGGALATIATKKLSFKYGIAACYTFGAPRVGDEKWSEGIKTPIYRLVNSADPVTIVPPRELVIKSLSWVVKFIPYIGRLLESKLLSNFGGYYDLGYMRFLTNVDNSNYRDAKLLYSVTFFRRFLAHSFTFNSLKKIPLDHSISVYRKKLKHIALHRNK